MKTYYRTIAAILTAFSALSLTLSLSGQQPPRLSSDSYPPPYLVKDFRELTQSSDPRCFALQDKLLCNADDGIHGRELWVSDGTEAGTYLMADIVPGESSWLSESNTRAFVAPDGDYSLLHAQTGSLWRTDGTEAGTYALRDPASGNHLYGGDFLARGSAVYVAARSGPDYSQGSDLWVTDGTEAGTHLVKDFNPSGMSEVNLYNAEDMGSYFLFAADDGTHGRELWRSDGTESGTYLVKDIRPGPDSGYPQSMVKHENNIFFVADDGVHGYELWRSDGTDEGTRLVKDIKPGEDWSSIGGMTKLGNVILFAADDGVHGEELWRSDGTSEGTQLVKDVKPGEDSSRPHYMTTYGGQVYFTPQQPIDNSELWRTDGTSEGTYKITTYNSHVHGFWVSSTGLLLISREDASGPSHCWLNRIDLSSGHLTPLHDQPFVAWDPSDPGSCNMRGPVAFEGAMLFTAQTEAEGQELWQTDGTAAGTHLVIDMLPGSGSASPSWTWPDIPLLGDRLYLSANGGGGDRELWWLDPDIPSTGRVADINQLPTLGHLPTVVLGMNETFTYLLADNGSYRGLFRTDGSPKGTFPLKQMAYTPYLAESSAYSDDGTFWMLNSEAQLYKSRGSQESTEMFWDFDTYSLFNTDLAVVGNTVYVSTPQSNLISKQISVTDGATAPQELIYFERADPLELIALSDDVLLFYREGYEDEHELWRSEGTAETTALVTKIDIASPGSIFEWKSEAYFCGKGSDATTFGLWKSDGTELGTTELVPNQHGIASFAATDNWLYYAIEDAYAEVKVSVWRTDGTEAGSHKIPHDFGVTDSDHLESFLGTEDLLYLVISNSVDRESLWVTDGTQQGTQLLHTANRPDGASYFYGFRNLVRAGEEIVFTTDIDNSLWITDGTIDGTRVLLAEAPAHAYDPFGTLYLRGYWNDLVLFGDLYAQSLIAQPTPPPVFLPAVMTDD